MPDRTINFGESETEATYQIQDTDGAAGGGNFVVAKDTNANTVLLEYQPGSDTWQYAGDVDMNGGNVSGVGTLTANSLNTDSASVTNQLDAGSVNTGEAIINGQPVRKVTSYQQSTTTTNTLTVEFDMTDLTPSEDYLIKFETVILADPGSVNVYIDNDTASGNANYKYFDQSGTAQSGQDQIQLVDTTAPFANVYGSVRYISNPSRPAVVSSLTGQVDRWVGYAQIGSYTTTPSDPTIQIEFVGGLTSGSTISLWRSI